MTEKAQNANFRRKPQIFLDSPLPLEIQAFGGCRKPQKTADFRRKPQVFAENRRKPQIGLRHLRCVTFSSALQLFAELIWFAYAYTYTLNRFRITIVQRKRDDNKNKICVFQGGGGGRGGREEHCPKRYFLFFVGNATTITFWKWKFYCWEILLSRRRLLIVM